ncbi:MAG: DUF2784 domain-containing protein [Rhodococcus sp.]|uniref:DUF2784 domain-containing protein n=1 Tax=Rhodococcus TaxID=1827 RepID=UPI0016AE0D02|nr:MULTISPECIES: DUF2784 domain-containing protein [Rhodococcus]NLV78914.1 DUF2784 domain-containing protein [Rhodococcus sp. (in: high G+C Gram-positive bacteria)]
MAYRLLADVVASVHLLFVLYVTFGGFLTWRWPRTVVLHVAAVVWGAGSVAIGFECPLTSLENWARRSAGAASLPPDGFIAHYLTGVVYPESAVGLVRIAVAVCVLASWTGLWWRRRAARRLAPGLTRQ